MVMMAAWCCAQVETRHVPGKDMVPRCKCTTGDCHLLLMARAASLLGECLDLSTCMSEECDPFWHQLEDEGV